MKTLDGPGYPMTGRLCPHLKLESKRLASQLVSSPVYDPLYNPLKGI